MKLSIPKIEKNEQIFFLSYVIFLFFSILMHSMYYRWYVNYYKYIAAGCIALLLLQEVAMKALSVRTLMGAVTLYSVAMLLAFLGSGDLQTSFACTFVYAFGARNIDFKKISRITIMVTLTLVVFVIASSMLGIITNYQVVQSGGTRLRYFLGFRYALNAPAMLLNVIMLYVFVKRDEGKYIEIALFLIFAVVLYSYTDSRLTFGLSIISLLIAAFCRKKKTDLSNLVLLPKLLTVIFPLCFAVSMWFAKYYSASVSWMKQLNAILGGRLRMGQSSLNLYGTSLFGNHDIKWIGAGLNAYGQQSTEAYFYVDNMYIQLLQRYGILFMVLFLILATLVVVRCYKKKENILVFLLAIVALHGLIDDGIIYVQMNTFWLLFGSALFGYKKSTEPEESVRGLADTVKRKQSII